MHFGVPICLKRPDGEQSLSKRIKAEEGQGKMMMKLFRKEKVSENEYGVNETKRNVLAWGGRQLREKAYAPRY